MILTYKDITAAALDVDLKSRRVKVVISETGSKDLDNDIIEPTAFTKTISERGPKGKNLIYHLIDHNPRIGGGMLSKFSELEMVGPQLQGVSVMPDTTLANDTLKLYDAGIIQQHSVGFQTVEDIYNKETGIRNITQIKLYEGSAVLWGANPNTPTLSVGKGIFNPDAIDLIQKQMLLMAKEVRDGKYTDDTFVLLEMFIKQLSDTRERLTKGTTEAEAQPSPLPAPADNREFLRQLKLLNLKFI